MVGFNENAFVRKLQNLKPTQESIQTLSLWLIHYRKHHSAIVKIWYKELRKAKDTKQLTFMYLANDVIQNSKKKGPEYCKHFGDVLIGALQHMTKTGINEKTKHSLYRILNILGERGVYDADKIQEFKDAVTIESKQSLVQQILKVTKRKPIDSDVRDDNKKVKNEREIHKSKNTVEVDSHTETNITLSLTTPPHDPPEPDELIKVLLDLETSASCDEEVRVRIAALPPEVSEVQLLSKLENKESVLYLSGVVNSAVELLANYNQRLSEELEKRRKLASMLRDFTQMQRHLAKQAEARLKEYNIKLKRIYKVKADVKSHIPNLSDESRLVAGASLECKKKIPTK